MNDIHYSDDDFRPHSPGLERVYPRAAPSPSPPPQVETQKWLKKFNRRKSRPSQGDWVLIREMAPNQPHITQQISQQDLNSDPGEYSSDDADHDDGEKEIHSSGPAIAPAPSAADTQPEGVSPEPLKAHKPEKKGPALAYQFRNTIFVEDEDGEVIKKYDIPPSSENWKSPGPQQTNATVHFTLQIRVAQTLQVFQT